MTAKEPEVLRWSMEIDLWHGAKYNERGGYRGTRRICKLDNMDGAVLAEHLRSLAREVERRSGIRPPLVSATAEASLEEPAATPGKEG